MYTRKRLTLLITILILTGAALSVLTPSIMRHTLDANLWSIQMLPAVLQGNRRELTPPPESHQNRCVWLIRAAENASGYHDGIDCFSKVEELLDPISADAQAWALYQAGQYVPAFDIWGDIGHAFALGSAGRELRSKGEYNLAYQAFSIAYENDPEVFLSSLFFTLLSLEKFDEIITIFQNLHYEMGNFNYAFYWRQLGDAYRKEGKWDQAESAYLTALYYDPTNSQLWVRLGLIAYDRDKDLAKAKENFSRAIEISPDQRYGYYAMGDLFYKEHQFQEAITWFEQALEYDPEHDWLLLLYATAFRRMGKYDQSLIVYNQLVNLHPEFAHAYHELAWAYYETGRLSEALTAIESALELMDSPNTSFYVRAGRIYEDYDKPAQALAVYQAALEIDPNNSSALQGVERLTGEQ